MLLWDNTFIKMEIAFGNFVPRQHFVTWVFPLSILIFLLTKLKVKTRLKPAKQSICWDSKNSRWPVYSSHKRTHESWEFPKRNSEVIYRFGENGKRADEWKQATICSTRVRKSVSQYKRWREVKAESLIGLMQVNHVLLIQILVLQYRLPQKGRCRNMEINKLWILPVNLLFFPCKSHWYQTSYLVHVNAQIWYSSNVVWSFPNKTKN